MDEKTVVRRRMRKRRSDYEAALPPETRALLFLRPPGRIADLAPTGSAVGIYDAAPREAPTRSYMRWFYENGRRIALPWFENRDAPMAFRIWADPFDEDLLEPAPFGGLQPRTDAEAVVPELMLLPLLAFTTAGDRLGQGGGHYDRWFAAHPVVPAIGLAWDMQRVDSLPREDHDHRLDAVITPTRLYEST